jgi:hypothetical protein
MKTKLEYVRIEMLWSEGEIEAKKITINTAHNLKNIEKDNGILGKMARQEKTKIDPKN